MIPTHCRHRTYPKPGGADRSTHCAAGVEYATLPYGTPRLGEGDPCDLRGHKAGRVCPGFSRWAAEEIEANEREWARVTDAMLAGRCPTCGGEMEKRENEHATVRWCPRCPEVSMRECRRIGEEGSR